MEPIDWQQVQLRGYPRLCEVIQMMENVLRRQEQTIADLECTIQSQAAEIADLRGRADTIRSATLGEIIEDLGSGWRIIRRQQ